MSLAPSRLRALAVTTVTALAASLLLLPTTTTAVAAPAPAATPAAPLGAQSTFAIAFGQKLAVSGLGRVSTPSRS